MVISLMLVYGWYIKEPAFIKEGKKTRGRMKLLLIQILKYFTEMKQILWQHLCIVEIFFLIDTKTLFMDV